MRSGKQKKKDIATWEENKVMERVPDEGQETMSLRWVITKKPNPPNGYFVKARLVVRGFEEDTSELETDSPTCSKEMQRILITIAAAMGWKIKTMDVKCAYLQGNKIQRLVYVRPPKEFAQGHIWLLKKTVYGLSDAARSWYNKVLETLIELGMTTDYLWARSLFYWVNNGVLKGIVAVHVDDFLYAGDEGFRLQVIEKFSKKFNVGSMSETSFTYLGLKLSSFELGITVDQTQYVDSIEHIPKDIKRSQNSKLTKKSQKLEQK